MNEKVKVDREVRYAAIGVVLGDTFTEIRVEAVKGAANLVNVRIRREDNHEIDCRRRFRVADALEYLYSWGVDTTRAQGLLQVLSGEGES